VVVVVVVVVVAATIEVRTVYVAYQFSMMLTIWDSLQTLAVATREGAAEASATKHDEVGSRNTTRETTKYPLQIAPILSLSGQLGMGFPVPIPHDA
jgi:hypothetical protein